MLRPGSTLGYLFDVIYQRDVWMHRVDTARATGPRAPARDSDAEVVGQVIRDLALVWDGPTAVLELSGPGAGRWLLGSGEPAGTARTDGVEYLRLLADRPPTRRSRWTATPWSAKPCAAPASRSELAIPPAGQGSAARTETTR